MKNKYVLDTSFLSSLIIATDLNHLKATQLLPKLLKSEVFIPATVIMELDVLPKSLGYRKFYEIIEFVLKVFKHSTVFVDESFIECYKELNKRLKSKVTTIDLSVLTSAVITKATLVSFDKKLLNIYEKLI